MVERGKKVYGTRPLSVAFLSTIPWSKEMKGRYLSHSTFIWPLWPLSVGVVFTTDFSETNHTFPNTAGILLKKGQKHWAVTFEFWFGRKPTREYHTLKGSLAQQDFSPRVWIEACTRAETAQEFQTRYDDPWAAGQKINLHMGNV
jgi:hypothetical protein